MIVTYEQLDELMGFDITEDSFFSDGTVIILDGSAWEVKDMVGGMISFMLSDDVTTGQENNDFFYDRAQQRKED